VTVVLDDIRTLVCDLLRDDVQRVSTEQLDRAIGLAVVQYGKDRPRILVEDVMAPGGRAIDLPDGALKVLAIEHPVNAFPPAVLPADAWRLYQTPGRMQILLAAPAAAGATLRLTVTRPHELTETVDTVPADDREAVASYAGAVLFDQIAAATSGDGNPTIQADTVNHAAKPENYGKRAERLRQRYHDLLGIDPKRVQPFSTTVTVPLANSKGGPRLLRRFGRP